MAEEEFSRWANCPDVYSTTCRYSLLNPPGIILSSETFEMPLMLYPIRYDDCKSQRAVKPIREERGREFHPFRLLYLYLFIECDTRV